MSLLQKLLNWLKPCTHVFAYQKTIDEQNLRTGHQHSSEIWKCVRCGKPLVIEHAD